MTLLNGFSFLSLPAVGEAAICMSCGFSDSKYFNSGFRRQYGCSPKEYRRNFRHEELKQHQKSMLTTQEFLSAASCQDRRRARQALCMDGGTAGENEPFPPPPRAPAQQAVAPLVVSMMLLQRRDLILLFIPLFTQLFKGLAICKLYPVVNRCPGRRTVFQCNGTIFQSSDRVLL